MKKYSIKCADKDFKFLEATYNARGSRAKRLTMYSDNTLAFFKYQGQDYIVSEAVSEKLSYEIAKILGFPCAKIELAEDNDGTLGVLNFLFKDLETSEHIDAVTFLKKDMNSSRKDFYTLDNIKRELDLRGEHLFDEFIRIMVFDALVGEQDRHEENWGLMEINHEYSFSPLYDNGCNLLREFKDPKYAEDYYTGKKDFEAYIKRSKTLIYKSDHKTRYKHFELIKELIHKYPGPSRLSLNALNNLSDGLIESTVSSLPDGLITDVHAQFIIKYLKLRRDILLDMLKGD